MTALHWIWPQDRRDAVYVDNAVPLVVRWTPDGVLIESVRQAGSDNQSVLFVPFKAEPDQCIQIIAHVESIILKGNAPR